MPVAPEVPAASEAAAAPDPFAALPAPGTTGSAPVDAALAGLAGVPDLPVTAHAAVYEDVHAALRDTLARLDA